MLDAELYREAVERSGLSANHFCEWIAWRDERTGRRWKAGDPMPPIVRARLMWFVALSPRRCALLVSLVRPRP